MPQYVEAEDLEKIVRGLNKRLTTLETREPTRGAGVWTPFTMGMNQGGAVAISSQISRYTRLGNVLFFESVMLFSGAGTPANQMFCVLPATVPPLKWGADVTGLYSSGGSFIYLDVSTGAFYAGTLHISSPPTNLYLMTGQGNTGFIGGVPAIAIASGDQLGLTFVGEC